MQFYVLVCKCLFSSSYCNSGLGQGGLVTLLYVQHCNVPPSAMDGALNRMSQRGPSPTEGAFARFQSLHGLLYSSESSHIAFCRIKKKCALHLTSKYSVRSAFLFTFPIALRGSSSTNLMTFGTCKSVTHRLLTYCAQSTYLLAARLPGNSLLVFRSQCTCCLRHRVVLWNGCNSMHLLCNVDVTQKSTLGLAYPLQTDM